MRDSSFYLCMDIFKIEIRIATTIVGARSCKACRYDYEDKKLILLSFIRSLFPG